MPDLRRIPCCLALAFSPALLRAETPGEFKARSLAVTLPETGTWRVELETVVPGSESGSVEYWNDSNQSGALERVDTLKDGQARTLKAHENTFWLVPVPKGGTNVNRKLKISSTDGKTVVEFRLTRPASAMKGVKDSLMPGVNITRGADRVDCKSSVDAPRKPDAAYLTFKN